MSIEKFNSSTDSPDKKDKSILVKEVISSSKQDMSNEQKNIQTSIKLAPKWPIVLVGMPANGKTAVGKEIASLFGVPFFDIDDEIEKRLNKTIARIFAEDGQGHFRQFEEKITLELLSNTNPAIISLGGGTIQSVKVANALQDHRVIHLEVPDWVAVTRIIRNRRRRPLFADLDKEACLAQYADLKMRREPLFAKVRNLKCVNPRRLSAEEYARQIARELLAYGWVSFDQVNAVVPITSPTYEVKLGFLDLNQQLFDYLRTNRLISDWVLVYPGSLRNQAKQIADNFTAQLQAYNFHLQRSNLQFHLLELPEGEDAKDLKQASYVWSELGERQIGRDALLVALGGGTVSDLVGFVAATWMRGIRFINLPTTIIAMVDAAIGGKTGINTKAGKNLVGAFHSPELVIADLNFLSTLPITELQNGLAEVVKCGFIDNHLQGGFLIRELLIAVQENRLKKEYSSSRPKITPASVAAAAMRAKNLQNSRRITSNGTNRVTSSKNSVFELSDTSNIPKPNPALFASRFGSFSNRSSTIEQNNLVSDPQVADLKVKRVSDLRIYPQLIARLALAAVNVKTRIVSSDYRENGQREFINFGHTFGHALEKISNYQISHGRAVALGCVFSAWLSHYAGQLEKAAVLKLTQFLELVGLPTKLPIDELNLIDNYKTIENFWEEILRLMLGDKKVRQHKLRFIGLKEIGSAIIINDPPYLQIKAAFEHLCPKSFVSPSDR